MNYWIDICDGITGERYGTIRTANNLEINMLLDRMGSLRFTVPAGDAQIDLLQVRRTAHVWSIVNDQVTELGAGVIERISIGGDNAPVVQVECSDLLRELSWRSVGDTWLADEIVEHPAMVFFLDGEYYGSPTIWIVNEATDYQVGDTTTSWQPPGTENRWYQAGTDSSGDFLYIAHWRQFNKIIFTRGSLAPNFLFGTPEWHVQYYSTVKKGWVDLTLNTRTCANDELHVLLAHNGELSWDMPDDWGLQNPNYEIRIFFQGDGYVVYTDIADIAVGYTRPTQAALERVMGLAPAGWSLDAANGYTATQPAEPVGDDLILNGDFAIYTGTPDDGTTDAFSDWTISGVDASNRIEATATAHEDSSAVKIVAATTGTPIIGQAVSATARKDYLLTFWTRGDGAAELIWRLTDVTSGEALSAWRYTGITGTDWTQITQRLTIPPQATTLGIEFSATAGTAYLDDVSFVRVNAGEIYLELADESVLEALNRIAEQTGEHFIRGTGRTVRWLGHDERRLDLWLSGGGDGDAKCDNAYAGHIIRLAEQQDGYELVSRIYVYGGSMGDQRVTLAHCTRTPPDGYTLNVAENYLERTDVDYQRIDKTLEMTDIMPYDLGEVALTDAANALYDRALAWLQTHSASNLDRLTGDQPRAYILDVAGCEQIILPGHLVRVTYIDANDEHIMQWIDDWLWVLEATLRISSNGVATWSLQAATVAALARTDAEAQVSEARINRALRRRGNLPLTTTGGGIIIGGGVTDHSGLSNLAYDFSGHTGFQRALALDADGDGVIDAQAANTALMGPTSGSNATPTFRALVVGDIPDLSAIYWLLADATIDGGYFTDTYVGSPFNIDGGPF